MKLLGTGECFLNKKSGEISNNEQKVNRQKIRDAFLLPLKLLTPQFPLFHFENKFSKDVESLLIFFSKSISTIFGRFEDIDQDIESTHPLSIHFLFVI